MDGTVTGKAEGEDVFCGLRAAELRTMGRALAHLAHDVQNHLAIISESAGWMKDILNMKKRRRFGWIRQVFKRGNEQDPDLELFFNGLNMIEKHVALASDLNQGLSSFAHHMEKDRSIFDGSKVLYEIRDVLFRQARDRDVHLEIKLAEGSFMIEAEPSVFQLAVFDSAEQAMRGSEKGDILSLESEVSEGQFQVHLTRRCREISSIPDAGNMEGEDFCRRVVEYLGGQTRKQTVDGRCISTLSFALAGSKL